MADWDDRARRYSPPVRPTTTDETVTVTAVVTERCNSTNGFVPGVAYPATRLHGGGFDVDLGFVPEGRQYAGQPLRRFVGADGSGGAHLQLRWGTGYDAIAHTAGKFEIRINGELV